MITKKLLVSAVVGAVVAALATLAAVALPAGPAQAHGNVIGPASRNYGCFVRWGDHFQDPAMATEDPTCYQAWQADPNAMRNWNGLYREGVAGNHQGVIPDGQLCSAGHTQSGRYNAMDTVGDWKATTVGNNFTVQVFDQALHGADYLWVYVTNPGFNPVTTPTTSPTTSPTTPPAPGACSAAYALSSQWPGGYQAGVTVTAGSAAIKSWTVKLTYPSAPTVQQTWNAAASVSGNVLTATNVSYNGALSAGGSTTFGFLGPGTATTPTVTCAATT